VNPGRAAGHSARPPLSWSHFGKRGSASDLVSVVKAGALGGRRSFFEEDRGDTCPRGVAGGSRAGTGAVDDLSELLCMRASGTASRLD
jgi:hypothetical protein